MSRCRCVFVKGRLVTLWGIALPTGVLPELTRSSELMGLRLHPLFSDRPPSGPVRPVFSFHRLSLPVTPLLYSFSLSFLPLFPFLCPRKVLPPEGSLWFSTFPHESSFIKQRARPRGKSLDSTMAENSTAIGEKSDPCCPSLPLSYLPFPPFPFSPLRFAFKAHCCSPVWLKRRVLFCARYEATLSNCSPIATPKSKTLTLIVSSAPRDSVISDNARHTNRWVCFIPDSALTFPAFLSLTCAFTANRRIITQH